MIFVLNKNALHAFENKTIQQFSTEQVSFMVQIKNEICSYKVYSVFVLPEEEMTIEVLNSSKNIYSFAANDGQIRKDSENRWLWQTPSQKGCYTIEIKSESGETMSLNIFVMVAKNEMKGEYLNGYRIGKYPDKLLKGNNIYKVPQGFIEVTKENKNMQLSPHFKLSQFLCKQSGGYPKYVVISEKLLLKLELILEVVNLKGYLCNTFFVMSAYRTPFYNKSLGDVKYSRHIFGDAADIFIDEDDNGVMDDLNRDHKINLHDAGILFSIIDDLFGKKKFKPFIGGLGKYPSTSNHGPFVHVDVRGFLAKWGDQLALK